MQLSKQLTKELDHIKADARFKVLGDTQQTEMQRLLLASPWLATWFKTQKDWLLVLGEFRDSANALADIEQCAQLWAIDDEITVMKDLRVWRNRHIARLIARDMLNLNTVQETARAVSDLADIALNKALAWCTDYWQKKEGIAGQCKYSSQPEQLIVIAMGKHGAQELNLSSDIDLIFAFPSKGQTEKGRSHEEFFTRVARKLIHLLDARTSDGFVFRVDMRLRPWGQSGAIVSNFTALQNYYLQQGRFWERFAMVKARAVTGAMEARDVLMKSLQPFVYRRYVDYQAVGALRDLKEKIQTEVRRQNLERNIKLGSGGIREVEFIAQVFQLIRGGQDEVLQARGTWPILESLRSLELLPSDVVDELVSAYSFLRDLEHRIQAIKDEQTQVLPIDQADLERLAISMQFDSVDLLMNALGLHREKVSNHFGQLISRQSEQESNTKLQPFITAWQVAGDAKLDGDSDELSHVITEFHQMPSVEKLVDVARQNLDSFMPLLWLELSRHTDAVVRFHAIRPVLEAIVRRTSYFVLLAENPSAITELVKLVPVSPWIGKLLQEKPFLLDELTDTASLYRLPDRAELMDEIHQLLLRVPEDDLERQMEMLRHFRHGRVLRAAACEVASHLPLMKISDYLAWVAEVVVEQSLALVWRQMVNRYGRPSKGKGEWCDPDFGVIAYGKMGGLELSYESDLDLVFLHNASPQGMTEGPKQIENVVFMGRLGQKLIHLLSAVTPSGMLYEVDTRLRPSGNSGLLVSSLTAFQKYQHEKAWTWEHQALVRARFIAGDNKLKAAFDEFRRNVICQQRDELGLRTEVIDMRQKMLDHLSSDAQGNKLNDVFDIKHDPGGIVDLEFLVQFCVLAYSHSDPDLSVWSDNVRSIEALFKAGIISELERGQWLEAYLLLRQHVHHAILSGRSTKLDLNEIDEELWRVRKVIQQSWQTRLVDSV